MGQSRHRFCSKARRTCGGKGCTPPRTPLRTHVNRGRSSFLMRVNRGRTSGAGRVARRSFAGWALVASARQGGELAPCGRSDSAALPPRLRSSHPAEFASGHAPRARGPPPSRGRPDLSGATHDPPDKSGLRVPEAVAHGCAARTDPMAHGCAERGMPQCVQLACEMGASRHLHQIDVRCYRAAQLGTRDLVQKCDATRHTRFGRRKTPYEAIQDREQETS